MPHEDIIRAAFIRGSFDGLNGLPSNPSGFSGGAEHVYRQTYNEVARGYCRSLLDTPRAVHSSLPIPPLKDFLKGLR